VWCPNVITLRRADERRHVRGRQYETWCTFYPQNVSARPGFGELQSLNEERLAPGVGVALHAYPATEIVTYVLEGTLAHKDSKGHASMIGTGEFHRMTSTRAMRHSEVNASRTQWAHVFQIGLYSSEARLGPSHEQKRFSAAERRGLLCAVASPDGRDGSLRIQPDTAIYSAMLGPGRHVVHELAPGRSGWLHVVRGEATLGDVVLTTGDGAGFEEERAVSLTAREETEILLVDLGSATPRQRAP
jgi:quercetin 2,3-dioxygenase